MSSTKKNKKKEIRKKEKPLKIEKKTTLNEEVKNVLEKDQDKGQNEEKIKQDSNKNLEEELLQTKKNLEKSLKDNLYLRAEFENFKRRSLEQESRLIRYGGEELLVSLANEVLDDLERAFFSAQKEEDFKNLKIGLEMIQKKLSKVLSDFGVQVLDPKGQVFDPSYQEALNYVVKEDIPEGHVAETFKKAYKLHDKIIRSAQVILAKKKEKE